MHYNNGDDDGCEFILVEMYGTFAVALDVYEQKVRLYQVVCLNSKLLLVYVVGCSIIYEVLNSP